MVMLTASKARPVQTLVISSEVVGQAGLGVDVTSWPNEFIETVLSPAVDGPDLRRKKIIKTEH